MLHTVEVSALLTDVWGWMGQVFSSVGLYRIAGIRKGRQRESGDEWHQPPR